MKQVDYIIVGLGLSGIAFCEQLATHGKSFVVYDRGPSASKVSGGVYNPVILKRYTLPWKSETLMDHAVPYYQSLEKILDTQLIHQLSVLRLFNAPEDQNNWFEALAKPGLSRFMSTKLTKTQIQGVAIPYHLGKVKEAGRINVSKLLKVYRKHLEKRDSLKGDKFIHSEIRKEQHGLSYGDVQAKRIVFAEGYGIKDNPFFNRLPLVGNKGEYLIIKAPELQLTDALKAQFFIIPQGDYIFKVGATFNWKEKDWDTTHEAREAIRSKLDTILSCDYEIIDQEAGVRPTTGDRRALLGTHPHHPEFVLLNGMGTRGIMMAPYLAKMLYDHLEHNKVLDAQVDLMRFPKKFE